MFKINVDLGIKEQKLYLFSIIILVFLHTASDLTDTESQ